MMNDRDFFKLSIGKWRSQRSAHHLAFGHYEQVNSDIEIAALTLDDPEVTQLCETYEIDTEVAMAPFRMTWHGESDWDDDEVSEGTTVLVPVPDPENPNTGRLLRDRGYAETIASVGTYQVDSQGVFILTTEYENAAAEERIWFVNPNFRLRVSLIKTSQGSGVVTASFSSEIRELN